MSSINISSAMSTEELCNIFVNVQIKLYPVVGISCVVWSHKSSFIVLTFSVFFFTLFSCLFVFFFLGIEKH